MTKFYKFGAPRTKRYASNGSLIDITVVSAAWGVFATSNPGLQTELDTMIAEQRGGVFPITEAEYSGLKKNQISTMLWREELGSRGYERNKLPVGQLPSQQPAMSSGSPQAVAAEANPNHGVQAESRPAQMERPKAIPRKKA